MTDEQAKRTIAKNLKARLDELGYSRYWLAKKTGKRESTIASVYNATSCCNAALLRTIADALEVTVDWLLKEESSRKTKKTANSA